MVVVVLFLVLHIIQSLLNEHHHLQKEKQIFIQENILYLIVIKSWIVRLEPLYFLRVNSSGNKFLLHPWISRIPVGVFMQNLEDIDNYYFLYINLYLDRLYIFHPQFSLIYPLVQFLYPLVALLIEYLSNTISCDFGLIREQSLWDSIEYQGISL